MAIKEDVMHTDLVQAIERTLHHPWLLAMGLFCIYVCVVRNLRYRRIRGIIQKVQNDCGRVTSSADLPLYHAEAIVQYLGNYEFPFMMTLSLQFALFRTYGIPSISSLLWKTRQLAVRESAHRRFVDTSIIIIEFMSFPLDSPRAKLAIERTNWLHSHHSNFISNDDLLYTLSLFLCQPVIFFERYEWRKLLPIEKIAMHRFWYEVGLRMGIKGIPNSYEGILNWANAYEEKYMVPDENNVKVAGATFDILLCFVPPFLHALIKPMLLAVMDDRLRAAFHWPTPPRVAGVAVEAVFGLRKLLIQNLALPRMYPLERINERAIDETIAFEERRYWYNKWETIDAWYYKQTWWNTYGPSGIIYRLIGWDAPSSKFKSDRGYRLGELGPVAYEKSGPGNAHLRRAGEKSDKIASQNSHPNLNEGGRCPMGISSPE